MLCLMLSYAIQSYTNLRVRQRVLWSHAMMPETHNGHVRWSHGVTTRWVIVICDNPVAGDVRI